MIIEKRFFSSGMNGDDNPRMIDDKSCLNIMNCRMAVSEHGRDLRLENVQGTTLVPNIVRPPYGTDQTIGTAVDDDNGRIVYFNYNTFGDHGIYCYTPSENRIDALIYDSQVIGGLGFSKNSLIHSARVENGNVYWADSNNNEPRRLNIDAAINMNRPNTFPSVTPYTYSMNQAVLRWIRRQPALPLTYAKNTDATFNNNFIKNEAFQFYWRYIYRDFELSTLSSASLLANYNQASQTFNFITVTAPLGEFIDQDVIQVDFVVKYLNSGKYFIFHSWNKNIAADAAAIYNHSYNSIPLSVDFYNDILGIALDDAYSVKPFDSVPIYAQTIEMARFRSFMFNYTIGYDTPTTTSLTAAAQVSTSGALIGQWVKIAYTGGVNHHYFIDLGSLGFFDVTPQPAPPPYPATEGYGNLNFVAAGPANFALYILANYPGWVGGIQYPGFSATITGGPAPPNVSGKTAFKSGASEQVSIEFLDHSGRKCGILTSPSLKIATGERSYDQLEFTTGINWSLSNANALTEIPVWAYYYSINITKCLTTRYFLQSRVKNITYATKDLATSLYLFNTTTFAKNLNGVGIDITLLNAYGMGYNFSEGDLVKVYIEFDANVYNMSIVAQQGNWIVCELKDLGTLGNTASPKTNVLFEIYTPYKASTSEPNYEVAQLYPIVNPTTNARAYSTVAGTITGDVTILTRNDGTNDYLTENMSPNDKFFGQWNTDSGRPNFIDTIGQVTKTNTIAYSNTLIQGTKTNGLSTYDALDTQDISLECGDGVKLQVANKVANEQGTIMLAICQHQTASCYLGEVQLVGSSQNAFVAQAAGVIGTVNILRGAYGSINPESVVAYLGLVFWIDLFNGVYIQYSNNGLEPVSRYKQQRFFKNYAKNFMDLNNNNLDNINGFHHIRSSVDPFTKEVLVSLPALIADNYAEVLPSYSSVPSYASSIIDRFDISDSLQKIMSYSFLENKWGQNYEWLPEWSEFLQNQSYLFKRGNLYIANDDENNWNTVFGVQYPVRVCVTGNINPSLLKDLATIGVEANQIPDFVVAMANYPDTQITDLASTDDDASNGGGWNNQQGIFYGQFFRDRLSPNVSGTPDEKLLIGDQLTDVAVFVMCEFQQYDSLFYLNFINIGWQPSRGQQAISNPINK